MIPNPDPGAFSHETTLKARLRQEFDLGAAAARDPQNAGLPDLHTRTTTIYSPWYQHVCPVCHHHFREGDRVRLCPQCEQAYHDDKQYDLHCWQTRFAEGGVCRLPRTDPITGEHEPGCDYHWSGSFPDESDGSESNAAPARRVAPVTGQFLRGLEDVWLPFGEESVIEVPAGSSLVGRKCPWCRFDIRAGDRVVKCPCGKCETYFHDDIFRHLTCWDDWNGSQGCDFCPTTGASIARGAPPHKKEGAGGG